MLVPFFIIGYLGLNFLIAADIYRWLTNFSEIFKKKKTKIIYGCCYGLLTSMIFVAFLLPSSPVKTFIARTNNYYLGFLINLCIALAVAHLIGLLLRFLRGTPKDFFSKNRNKLMAGIACAVFAVGFSIYGFINANVIKTNYFDVSIEKKGDDMKVVLVADLHLGYSFGITNLREMVEKINQEDPDVVCLAGDIFDNDYDALDDPEGIEQEFSSIKSKYGVFACWGNHDVSDKLLGGFTTGIGDQDSHDERMTQLLERSGIILLEDEVYENDKISVIGRLDYAKPANGGSRRKFIAEYECNTDNLVIEIDHEPKELQESADVGADLYLCGHTHNGQFFPLNIATYLMWENAAGMKTKTSLDGRHIMYNIVTQGVGVYGPFMRTFTDSEIAVINVHMQR